MQPNFDQEMDKLLRAHGAASSRVQNETRAKFDDSSSAHLDADALIAYIENALPVVTREHYTAHLADCAPCRRLAATFASTLDFASQEISSNVIASEEVAREKTLLEQTATNKSSNKSSAIVSTVAAGQSKLRNPNSTIKEWFAFLLAPSFMRYAVPVLIVGVVGVVTYIAFNSSQRKQNSAASTDMIATRTQSDRTPSAAVSQTASNADSASAAKTLTPNSTTKQAATNNALAKPEQSPIVAKDSQDARREDERARTNEKPGDAPQTSTRSESDPSGAQLAQSKPSAPPKSANVADDELTRVERKQQNEPARQEQNPQNSRTSNAETQTATTDANKSANDLATTAPAPAVAATTARRAGSGAAKKAESNDKEKSDRDVRSGAAAAGGLTSGAGGGVRAVAGHRFQRQNGVWIDAAYNSQKIINVTRDSEQFRALASDEPELRRIADELSGTIIVVLRGRAYRIR